VWSVLRTRDFALVWCAGLLALSADWFLFVGLPLFVYDQTGSTLATGAVFVARFGPYVLLGSVAGMLVDRWDRRRTLFFVNLLLAAAAVPLLIGARLEALGLVYAAAAAMAALQQFVVPAEDALIPRLVGEQSLVPANALNALNNNLARLGGPPLGAALYAVWGLEGVAITLCFSLLLGALLLSRVTAEARPLRTEPLPDSGSPWTRAWADWLAGLRLVTIERRAAVLIGFAAITGLGEGVISALFVFFVRDLLDAGGFAYGALLAVQAIGGLLGGLIVGRFFRGVAPVILWGVGALGLAAIDTALFLYPSFLDGVAPAAFLLVAAGVPVAALIVGVTTVRQLTVPDAFRGRLTGSYRSAGALAAALGAIGAGLLGERVPLVPLLMIQVAGYALGGLAVFWFLVRRR
jgi:MFS family permease